MAVEGDIEAVVGGVVQRVTGAIVADMRVLPNPSRLLAVFLVSLVLWFLPSCRATS